jgi:hypothetical protein
VDPLNSVTYCGSISAEWQEQTRTGKNIPSLSLGFRGRCEGLWWLPSHIQWVSWKPTGVTKGSWQADERSPPDLRGGRYGGDSAALTEKKPRKDVLLGLPLSHGLGEGRHRVAAVWITGKKWLRVGMLQIAYQITWQRVVCKCVLSERGREQDTVQVRGKVGKNQEC